MNLEQRTIAGEREHASFDVTLMQNILDGGVEETKFREIANTLIERDPLLCPGYDDDCSRPEARIRTFRQLRRSVEVRRAMKDEQLVRAFNKTMSEYDTTYMMKAYVHDVLFKETLFSQGTKEQFEKYKQDIEEYNVLGCYSMTELGHSSFLRGIETTATYDSEREEFVIHSPSITATKWWIGMAGQTATHTVALCQVVTKGEMHGLAWFVIPLRDTTTGRLKAGVTCGDIGAKAGRNGLDNGWLQFSHVRVPHSNMLAKWCQVDPKTGEYSAPADQSLAYNTLIGERFGAVYELHACVGRAVTIATRYSAVRRQGAKDQQLLWFQSQQRALFPVIALVYISRFAQVELTDRWTHLVSTQDNDRDAFLKQIPDYHCASASMKAWLGWMGSDALEAIRRTMGGHAYSAYNALSGMIGDWGVITTGGGDNIVLAQQGASQIIGSMRKALKGKPLFGSVKYLEKWGDFMGESSLGDNVSTPSQFQNVDLLIHAHQWLTIRVLASVGETMQKAMKDASGKKRDKAEVWNDNMMEALPISRLHTIAFTMSVARDRINATKVGTEKEKAVLNQLLILFGLTSLEKELNLFSEHGYLSPEQCVVVRRAVTDMCKALRPEAVSLVDALGFPDFVLKAPVGAYDGDIYRKYLARVQAAPNCFQTPYWDSEVRPLLASKL